MHDVKYLYSAFVWEIFICKTDILISVSTHLNPENVYLCSS